MLKPALKEFKENCILCKNGKKKITLKYCLKQVTNVSNLSGIK